VEWEVAIQQLFNPLIKNEHFNEFFKRYVCFQNT